LSRRRSLLEQATVTAQIVGHVGQEHPGPILLFGGGRARVRLPLDGGEDGVEFLDEAAQLIGELVAIRAQRLSEPPLDGLVESEAGGAATGLGPGLRRHVVEQEWEDPDVLTHRESDRLLGSLGGEPLELLLAVLGGQVALADQRDHDRRSLDRLLDHGIEALRSRELGVAPDLHLPPKALEQTQPERALEALDPAPLALAIRLVVDVRVADEDVLGEVLEIGHERRSRAPWRIGASSTRIVPCRG
jgi:hypothetical protein